MALVKTYSLEKDGEKSLSRNFKVREFRCKDGSDTILISDELVKVLEAIRSYFGKPITITSGYRTPAHNREVGGAKGSQHVKGTAADIKVKDIPTWAVAGFLEANYRNCGIGYYSTWVHVDTRGYRALWRDYGTNTKGTFGIGKNYTMYKAKEPEDTMTDKEVFEAFNRYAKTQIVPEWAKKEFSEAVKAGITDGTNPCGLIPRYQAAIMALRASKK